VLSKRKILDILDLKVLFLKLIFKKWDGEASGSERGQVVGACECGNERSGSINCGEFLE